MDKKSRSAPLELILGGARSGKSRYAEQQAQAHETVCNSLGESDGAIHYVATAQAYDDEMTARIERHQQDRPTHWLTCESPLALADTLSDCMSHDHCSGIVVDCLTFWMSNWFMKEDEGAFQQQRTDLLSTLNTLSKPIWLVSNEVGHGIVPMGELSRRFVDEAGWLHQDIAAMADKVTWVAAGLPVALKNHGQLQLG